MSKHNTAVFLFSNFLSSKRSVKKIYGLNPAKIGILFYICISIDLNYSKRKQFNTGRLLQAQIAKYCGCSRKTANEQISYLIKKRLLKYDSETFAYSLGKILKVSNESLHDIDVLQIVTGDRCVTNRYTSNSSNYTNRDKKSFSVDKSKKLEEKHQPAETAKRASDLLEAFVRGELHKE